ESRVDEVRRAKQLRIALWAHPGSDYEGVLREIAPDTDRVSRTYAARITVKNPDARLMLGMTASVVAPDVEGARAIRLPLTAIYHKNGQPLGWIVEAKSSTGSTRAGKIAGAKNEMVLIADGLAGGETVVTAGVHMLHAGQRVKAVPTPAPAPAPQ